MIILLGNLFIVYIASLFSRINFSNRNTTSYKKVFIYIALISLILVSGLRYGVGTDFGTYSGMYRTSKDFNINDKIPYEVGLFFLNKLLNYISSEPQLMFLVTSIIINILIVFTLNKKSEVFELSMYLYITTYMYFTTFNVLRQWIAGAILFAATDYLLKRKWKHYFVMVLIAFLFHQSSIIMIFIYFIVNHKFTSKKNLIIASISIGIFTFYNGFLEKLFLLLQQTKYEGYTQELINTGKGAHILRFGVYLLPVIVTFILYKKINDEKSMESDIIMNMCFIGMLIMFLSLKHAYFARLSTYFELYYLLLIPKFVRIQNKNVNRLIYYSICMLYLMFCIFLLRKGDGQILPYRWIIPQF